MIWYNLGMFAFGVVVGVVIVCFAIQKTEIGRGF